jgi:hypothetical protein
MAKSKLSVIKMHRTCATEQFVMFQGRCYEVDSTITNLLASDPTAGTVGPVFTPVPDHVVTEMRATKQTIFKVQVPDPQGNLNDSSMVLAESSNNAAVSRV